MAKLIQICQQVEVRLRISLQANGNLDYSEQPQVFYFNLGSTQTADKCQRASTSSPINA